MATRKNQELLDQVEKELLEGLLKRAQLDYKPEDYLRFAEAFALIKTNASFAPRNPNTP